MASSLGEPRLCGQMVVIEARVTESGDEAAICGQHISVLYGTSSEDT